MRTETVTCDYCGNLYEFYEGVAVVEGGSEYSWLRLFTTHGTSYKTYDLCPNCMENLIQWINYGKAIEKIRETIPPDEIVKNGIRYVKYDEVKCDDKTNEV